MPKTNPSQENNPHKLVIAGLLASAAVGAVYFYGKNKKKTQEKLRGWVLKVKGEVMERVASAETLTRSRYNEFIDAAVEKFSDKKHIAESEAEKLRENLKARWGEIVTHVENGIEEFEGEGVATAKSAVTKALSGAAKELSDHKSNQDIDAVEQLKRAGVSGIEEALQDLTTSIDTESGETNSSN
jgi:hypothetical protein